MVRLAVLIHVQNDPLSIIKSVFIFRIIPFSFPNSVFMFFFVFSGFIILPVFLLSHPLFFLDREKQQNVLFISPQQCLKYIRRPYSRYGGKNNN